MSTRQHIVVGTISGAAVFLFLANLFGHLFGYYNYTYAYALLWFVIGCIGGSMAPDVDTPGSYTNHQMFGCVYEMHSARKKGPKFHSLAFALSCCKTPIIIGAILTVLDYLVAYPAFDWFMLTVVHRNDVHYYYRIFTMIGYPFLFFGLGMLYSWILHLFHDSATPGGVYWTKKHNFCFKHFRIPRHSWVFTIVICIIWAEIIAFNYISLMHSFAENVDSINYVHIPRFPLTQKPTYTLPEFSQEDLTPLEDAYDIKLSLPF